MSSGEAFSCAVAAAPPTCAGEPPAPPPASLPSCSPPSSATAACWLRSLDLQGLCINPFVQAAPAGSDDADAPPPPPAPEAAAASTPLPPPPLPPLPRAVSLPIGLPTAGAVFVMAGALKLLIMCFPFTGVVCGVRCAGGGCGGVGRGSHCLLHHAVNAAAHYCCCPHPPPTPPSPRGRDGSDDVGAGAGRPRADRRAAQGAAAGPRPGSAGKGGRRQGAAPQVCLGRVWEAGVL